MNITEAQELAVKRNAQSFFTDTKLRNARSTHVHSLTWSELENVKKVATREASNLAGVLASFEGKGMTDDGLNSAYEALADIVQECEREKDIRTAEGSREPRAQAESRATLSKRPGFDAVDVDGGANVEIAQIALRSDQPMKAWAQARSGLSDNLRGMNAGQFLRAMIVNDKTDVERRALAEATDSAGGYTVPDVLSAELIDAARAASVVVRAGARTVPLTSDQNTIAKVLADPTPAWRAEAGAVANSDPTFGPVVLTPRSLAVQVDISAELMADSLNLATALPNILAAAMAVELDRVALIGSGTAPEPRGIANTVGIGTFAQNADIIGYSNLSRARTGILTANRGPVSAYIMHPRDEGSFVDLLDSTGQPLMAPNAVSSIPMLTTTSLPVDGGTGTDESTIIAGNFAHLLIGIRSGIQVELFKGPKYISNLQYTMIAHMRADIAVEDPAAFYTLTGVGRAA